MSVQEFISRQFRRYRDLLANLSRKNRELYFREGKAYTINLSKMPKVSSEHSGKLAEKFKPIRTMLPAFQELLTEGTLDLSTYFQIEETGNGDLANRLDKIRLADDKFQREFGISGAWLLGPFLCWRDTSSYKPEDLLISPVFKLPIDLSKDKRKRWTLHLEDNKIEFNPSLILALKQRWGIILPEEPESETVIEALDEFTAALKEGGKNLGFVGSETNSLPKIPPRFKIIKDEEGNIIEKVPVKLSESLSTEELQIYEKTTHQEFSLIDVVYIDQLNASRMVLIRDYDEIIESTETHPILSELFLGKPISHSNPAGKEQLRALDAYKEKDNFFVVNIDSSQHRAIDIAAKTRAIVIQGPPGTGKSQTITNLIAENLAKGKKVLFVSEKRPALDVVHARLQKANLDSQAVLIHSSDLKKQELYNSFLELSHAVHDVKTDAKWERVAGDLDRAKNENNKLFSILESEHPSSGLLISEVLAKGSEIDGLKSFSGISNLFSHCSTHGLERVCELVEELQEKVGKVTGFATHPWLHRKPNIIHSETLLQRLTGVVDRALAHFERREALKEKTRGLGIVDAETEVAEELLSKTEVVEILPEWIAAARCAYLDEQASAKFSSLIGEPLQTLITQQSLYERVRLDANADMARLLETYFSVGRGPLDWVTPNFWKMRGFAKQYVQGWDGSNAPLRAFRLAREAIGTIRSLLKERGVPVVVDEASLSGAVDACEKTQKAFEAASHLGRVARSLGLHGQPAYAELSTEAIFQLKACIRTYLGIRKESTEIARQLDSIQTEISDFFEVPPKVTSAEFYQSLIAKSADLDRLDQIDLTISKIKDSLDRSFGCADLMTLFIPLAHSWKDAVLGSVYRSWIDDVRAAHPEVRTFDSGEFKRRIEKFHQLETDHRNASRDVVNNTLFKRWNQGLGEAEGLSLLKKEANKQRKVLSPREIMEKGALSAMMKLKPCWLMSPLSISQILPLQAGLFDTIIFDEASQVRVEDAVPSIYRANTMIVVGDPKQMPPTNFFSSGDLPEDDDEDDVEIAASVLDLAAQVYPSEILEWHYRSRAEALIAFSNRAFYGGRLIAVPNPRIFTEGDAIRFHRIQDGYFNQKNGNSTESKAVVERLAQLLKEHTNSSFGIITMGQAQMASIEAEIELKSQQDELFRELYEKARAFVHEGSDAGIFVKNLENVQGDERDIILMSIGYAPSAQGKKLNKNFGPLSQKGGGRRLNVAVTRAKEQIEVFCSFNPSEIPTEEADFGKNPDLVLFGRYLKYTNALSSKHLDEAISILNSFGVGGAITTRKSSNFSKDVKRRLEELGYKVSAEIGTSGFYVDLGIHHPVIPSNFVIGIECDGAMFHSTPYARDRDKIREELLVSRGWKIDRVWSTDWSKDWKAEINRLDRAIKAILEGRLAGQSHLKSVK